MSLKRRLLAQEDKLTELKVRCERRADTLGINSSSNTLTCHIAAMRNPTI